MDTKRCPSCGDTLPLTAFHVSRKAADGRQGWCKKCAYAEAARYGRAQRAVCHGLTTTQMETLGKGFFKRLSKYLTGLAVATAAGLPRSQPLNSEENANEKEHPNEHARQGCRARPAGPP